MTYEEFKKMINYLEDYHLEHKLSEDDIKLLKFNNCWSEDELPYCSWDNYNMIDIYLKLIIIELKEYMKN